MNPILLQLPQVTVQAMPEKPRKDSTSSCASDSEGEASPKTRRKPTRARKDSASSDDSFIRHSKYARDALGDDSVKLAKAIGRVASDATSNGCSCCPISCEVKVGLKWLFFTVLLCVAVLIVSVLTIMLKVPEGFNQVEYIRCAGKVPLNIELLIPLDEHIEILSCQTEASATPSAEGDVSFADLYLMSKTQGVNHTQVVFEFAYDVGSHPTYVFGIYYIRTPSRRLMDGFRMFSVAPVQSTIGEPVRSVCVEELRVLSGASVRYVPTQMHAKDGTSILGYVCGRDHHTGMRK